MTDKHLAYRVRILPAQLDAARRKVAALENEALRYRMFDLVPQGAARPPASSGGDAR